MKPAPKFLKQHLLPAVAFFGAALVFTWLGLLDRTEFNLIDAQTRLRASLSPTPPPDQLVLIGVAEQSLKKFGRWPWSRDIHGDFVQLAAAAEARVITWDILFTEPSRDAKEDAHFVDGVKAAKESDAKTTVILGANFGEKALNKDDSDVGVISDSPEAKASTLRALPKVEGDRSRILSDQLMLLPAGELGQTAQIAFVSTPPGPDGIRRRVPLMVRVGDNVYPTLSLQSLLLFWGVTPDNVTVRLGDAVVVETPQGRHRIPIDEQGRFLLNYRHLAAGIQNHDYSRTFDDLFRHYGKDEEAIKPPDLKGKILLVGQVADGLSDIGPSPFSALTPLVMVHANVIENILKEDYARQAPPAPAWLGAFVLGLVGLVFFSKRKLRDHAIYALGLPLVYAGAAYCTWAQWSLWLPLAGPVLGFVSLQVFEVGRRVIAEQKAKQEIKGMFGTYVSPALVSKMIDSGTPPQLGGHEEEITAYFSDIQAFSSFSEKLTPARLVELMNEYLTACTDIVQEQGGTLDKYIGDAVVAMFGAPIPLTDHAFRACVASQLVHLKLAELRKKWEAEGDKWPQIVWRMQSRIGLNSGRVIVGNMGSRTRFNYTMMGDDVNLAARMESGSKQYGAYTMCAEATKLACEKHGGDRIVFRYMDKIVVKGRSIPVPTYEIVGLKENVTAQTHECLGVFAEGITRYLAQDWAGAETLFRKSAGLEPNIPGKTPGVESNPSLALIARCGYMREHPPGPGWDGVFHMKEK